MKQSALKSTTAILMVLSLGQPIAGLAQSAGGVEPGPIKELPLPTGRDWPDIAPEQALICIDEGITDAPACVVFLDARDADAAAGSAGERAEEQQQADIDAARAAVAELEAAEAAAQEAADALQAEAIAQKTAEAEAEARAAADADEAAKIAAAAEDTATRAAADATAAEAIREQDLADAQAAADAVAKDEAAATIAASDTTADVAEDVTSETLSADTQRSSSEEFQDQSAQGQPIDPTTQTSASNGLSDLERAGLFALGAVAVGAILLNGQRVQSQTGDRVIVVDEAGTYSVLKDDDALLRAPGSEVRTERFADGSTRTVVTREDGTQIITVRDVNGRALRRVRVEPDGREYLLIDDTQDFQPVIVRDLPPPTSATIDYQTAVDRDTLRLALLAADQRDIGRNFSLRQVREIVEVRRLAPEINLAGITFETNSAAIAPAQAEQLREMGLLMRDLVRDNPTELFLVEGHTDAIGDAGYNLLLSDRRAESVALAFSEYFGVNAENMIVQGYGERFLKLPTQSAERLNRRVAVRRITALVRPN
jgi:outer membrane protein OmpA-like peptidoglycan-associated protein/multidrug efflux pump subunit AcrA (membrane-fusion protein)